MSVPQISPINAQASQQYVQVLEWNAQSLQVNLVEEPYNYVKMESVLIAVEQTINLMVCSPLSNQWDKIYAQNKDLYNALISNADHHIMNALTVCFVLYQWIILMHHLLLFAQVPRFVLLIPNNVATLNVAQYSTSSMLDLHYLMIRLLRPK